MSRKGVVARLADNLALSAVPVETLEGQVCIRFPPYTLEFPRIKFVLAMRIADKNAANFSGVD